MRWQLIAAGAEIEARDARGRTPLLAAAGEYDRADMVLGLLAAGANPTAQDQNGRTALDYAQIRGDSELAEILKAVMP